MLKKYSYVWVTLVLFTGSFIGQWFTHSGDTTKFLNAVFENWQSEFLQLIWQVMGLMFLLCVGSPASRDGQDRLEKKVDQILEKVSNE